MIIIPIKWLFHWEYTLFSDTPIYKLKATVFAFILQCTLGKTNKATHGVINTERRIGQACLTRADLVVMNRSSNLARWKIRIIQVMFFSKKDLILITKYGHLWQNVGNHWRKFKAKFPRHAMFDDQVGQLEGSLRQAVFSSGNQPVEKTCNPIFSSHDIWKGLQNRMLQIQFLICAGFPSLTEHQMKLVDGSYFVAICTCGKVILLWLRTSSSEEFSAPLTRTSTLWLCQNSYWKWPSRNSGFTHL